MLSPTLNEKRIKANDSAIKRIEDANPVILGVKPAIKVVPGMHKNLILTSGAIQDWNDYYGGQRMAIIGAALFEGLGKDEEDVVNKITCGEIIIHNCHDYSCVGSLAGVYSASMPVFIVQDKTHHNYAYCNIYEGSNKRRLNYGIYDHGVKERLLYIEKNIAPILNKAITAVNGIELKPIMAKALKMGDELHSRSSAATLIFSYTLITNLLTKLSSGEIAEVHQVLGEDQYFFLRIGMAAAKVIADSIRNIEYCSIVSAMCFDCQNFNIRVSGLNNEWFRANISQNLHEFYQFSGDIDLNLISVMGGESIINETIGLGGLSQAAAPALMNHQGGSFDVLLESTHKMYDIVHTISKEFLIPVLNFKGVPLGIDIFKVLETKITPIMDIGIPSKLGGQLGAGTALAPYSVFKDACEKYVERYT